MLIIADFRLPATMHHALTRLGEIVWFRSRDVYEAIEGHPDNFLCQIPGMVVASPNLPEGLSNALRQTGILQLSGETRTENRYPFSARYNAVAAHGCFIHNLIITDRGLLEAAQHLRQIHVGQGYTRCNLLPLPDGSFITSDMGILRTLQRNNLDVFYANPSGILLPGFAHGFIGGTAGWCHDTLVFAGNPQKIGSGMALTGHLTEKGIKWTSLADDPLVDVGGLFFFATPV